VSCGCVREVTLSSLLGSKVAPNDQSDLLYVTEIEPWPAKVTGLLGRFSSPAPRTRCALTSVAVRICCSPSVAGRLRAP